MSAALDAHRARPATAAAAPAEDESISTALIARTKSIRQISNQLKMLAPNALIEGSRAGVQGAGFSVVAQEVRGGPAGRGGSGRQP